ncbi:DUF6807 family protein [Kineococcus rhizosphaerae]|uniref:Methane monooxygenase PmoA-like n=1 Tax=Kineococcus rhizosphaerae TaxID=559628 RepID=A0A2T0QXD7_9ACTN|nr:DUF6807 family protein [Kineococcus rhizosphaerae]PRY10548.1 methane monooxygenase PmoA-like [Kineococcus rhizosphaerae]
MTTTPAIDVLELRTGEDLAPESSPRPYLHPVRTLAGTVVTASGPADHPHHHGVSMAVADLSGTSHWGGRTHVRGRGSTPLPNHGRQVVVDRRDHEADPAAGPDLTVEWSDAAGVRQGREERRVRVRPHPAGWVLSWSTLLVPDHDLSVGSPATNGRPGAFYGGWFWRTPFPAARVCTADGAGTDRAHGSSSPWLLLSAPGASLLAVQRGPARPWFVRTEGYVGFGPALAVTERLPVTPDRPLVQEIDVLVSDDVLDDPRAASLAAELLEVQA